MGGQLERKRAIFTLSEIYLDKIDNDLPATSLE
jgi:hypothetical protein